VSVEAVDDVFDIAERIEEGLHPSAEGVRAVERRAGYLSATERASTRTAPD
jgi:hypothetical protein